MPVEIIERLKSSSIWHIDIVSRRGLNQVSFKAKELWELLNLPSASMDLIPSSLFPDLSSSGASRQESRILALLSEGSKYPPRSTLKMFSVRFLRLPQSSSPSRCTIMYDLNTADNMYGEPLQVQFGLEK
jgi:adrenodoxin-NADP+ reductase